MSFPLKPSSGDISLVPAIHEAKLTSGSGWKEYAKSGTVHGMPMPPGLKESERLPNPMFTPSTKAELGQHDENIHPDQCTHCPQRELIKVKEIIGPVKAAKVEELALALYTKVPCFVAMGVDNRLLLTPIRRVSSSLIRNSNLVKRKPEKSSSSMKF